MHAPIALFDALKEAGANRLSMSMRDGLPRAVASRDDGPWEPVSLVLPAESSASWEAALDALAASTCESADWVVDPSTGLQLLLVRHRRVDGASRGTLRRVDFAVPEADVLSGAFMLARHASAGLRIAGVAPAGCHAVVHGPGPVGPLRDAWARSLGEELALAGFTVVPESGIDATLGVALLQAAPRVVGGDGLAVSASVLAAHEALRAMDATLGLVPSESTVLLTGLGAIGLPLARRLVAENRKVCVSDRDLRRIDGLIDGLSPDVRGNVTTVAPYQASSTPCDIFIPAAPVGSLRFEDVLALRTRGVVGPCETPILVAGPEDDGLWTSALFERGICAAPSGFATAGVFSILSLHAEGKTPTPAAVHARTTRIARGVLGTLLDACRRRGADPSRVITASD